MKPIKKITNDMHNTVTEGEITSDEIVTLLAEWSKKYPRGGIYSMNSKMDEQLIEIEEKAKDWQKKKTFDQFAKESIAENEKIHQQIENIDAIEKSLSDYPLIPMDQIEEEARKLAVRWVENYEPCGFDLPNKHKLASDIMNYSKKHQIADNRDEEIKRLRDALNKEWISVEDKPLFIKTHLGWECTEDGDKPFIAAVPYKDKRKPGEELWWIRQCVIEDRIGLCVVGDDDNEPAGWDMGDITHYQYLPKPPVISTRSPVSPDNTKNIKE